MQALMLILSNMFMTQNSIVLCFHKAYYSWHLVE